MKKFGSATPCKFATTSREYDYRAHLYTLALVAWEYQIPTSYFITCPSDFVVTHFGDGLSRLNNANHSWGKPFRLALRNWLELISRNGINDQTINEYSEVSIWNNALECPNLCPLFGGEPEIVRKILNYVEPSWASKALEEAYNLLGEVDIDVKREVILLRAENKALKEKASIVPDGWKTSGVHSFERFRDIGALLAYAAWTADWLSAQG